MRKKIAWEHWRDPLLSNYEDEEWPGYDLDENGDKIPVHTVERQPVMHTPHGMVSVLDDSMASNDYDFWVMHTNFDLNRGVAGLIETVDGVETMEVYTRYRARLGFPRSGEGDREDEANFVPFFRPRDVMNRIDDAVREYFHYAQNQTLVGLGIQTAEKVIETRDKLDKEFDHWTIWVLPNGNVEVLNSDGKPESFADYQHRLSVLKKAHQTVGGRLLSSESE
jgi:hypothetical protein